MEVVVTEVVVLVMVMVWWLQPASFIPGAFRELSFLKLMLLSSHFADQQTEAQRL